MPIEPTTLFQHAEDFLRRHIKSKAVREAEKRRSRRRTANAMRRLGRATLLGGSGGAGILLYGAVAAPLAGPVLIAAVGVTAVAAGAALLWPSRRASAAGGFSREELATLPVEAEEWLLLQRPQLPGRAAPALELIFQRLADLQPRLGEVDPNSTLAWEARRLIGDHLPNLVADYCALPSITHERDPEVRTRLIEGLTTLSEQLADLCEEVSRDQRHLFETRGRFIESRYRDGDRLSGR
jgi:hypothetical protein